MSENVVKNGQLVRTAGAYLVDAQLSENSTNAVQNKVVTEAIKKCPVGTDVLGSASATPRDADTLGGLYSASDITSLNDSLATVEESLANKSEVKTEIIRGSSGSSAVILSTYTKSQIKPLCAVVTSNHSAWAKADVILDNGGTRVGVEIRKRDSSGNWSLLTNTTVTVELYYIEI